MNTINANLTDLQTLTILRVLEGEIANTHNLIASAVEGDWNVHSPKTLVERLRELQDAAKAVRRAKYDRDGYGS